MTVTLPEICEAGVDSLRELPLPKAIAADISDFEEFWSDFDRYAKLEHVWGRTTEAPTQATLAIT